MNSGLKFLQQRRTDYIEMLVVSKKKTFYYYIIGFIKQLNTYVCLQQQASGCLRIELGKHQET